VHRPQRLLRASLAVAALLTPALVDPQTVVDELEVTVLELEVTVRDRRGRGVAGLAVEDFSVSLGGELAEITNFRAVATGGSVETSTTPSTGSPQVTGPRHVVLYFDESSLDAGERRDLARRLGVGLAAGLAPGARVLVAGRQGLVLRIHQPFTDRLELLLPAIEAA
jgi:hypothetical protein